jgi:hypothetical protein
VHHSRKLFFVSFPEIGIEKEGMVVEAEDSAMAWMCDRGLTLYHVKLG